MNKSSDLTRTVSYWGTRGLEIAFYGHNPCIVQVAEVLCWSVVYLAVNLLGFSKNEKVF